MNNEITLTDLFDVEMLQRLQDAFAKMMGLAAIITDANGIPVTKGTNFTEFCSKYTRRSPIGRLRCQQCDKHGAELALKVGSSVTYYCHAGLMDFAAPIMAGDKMVGCFVGGQVLTSPPDITKIMQVSSEIDVDLINFLQAALSVPYIKKSKLENSAVFLYTLTDALSSIAYHKYIIKEANIEIEKAANMKSDFLANMSHELRTPMNAVIGMAEMALREDMTPAAKNCVTQIKNAGKSLLTIINDILDFSKIESGKMDIMSLEYEPLSMINDVSNIIITRIDNGNIEFVLDINPNMPKTLYGDNIRLKQIIINLANNADKKTKCGQVLLKFDFERTSDSTINFICSVVDTGIGIKSEDMDKLFKSFQQVDSKRNRNIEGTGLGLAISKRLLSLMNGDIKVESVYGEGSTFSFTVPQRVIEDEPSVSLAERPAARAFGWIKNHYVHEQLKRDMRKLDINYTPIEGIDILSYLKENEELLNDAYLFVSLADFVKPLQDFLEEHKKINVVIYAPYNVSVQYDSLPNVAIASAPMSIMSIAAIYNHESLNLYDSPSSDQIFDFTAETAKILIVDDNSINLTVAEGLLEPLNMQIDTALSGNEALDKISQTRYDLILMDHMMPELDGIETTHIIRRMHPEYDDVPIIALTANAIGDVRSMFIKEGMNDFVAKPIEVRMFVIKIRKWLPKEKIKKHTVSTKRTAVKKATVKIAASIQKIPGLNVEDALKLVGNEKLYMNILKDYYIAIPKKIAMIQTYLAEQNWHNYTIEVHALKSASRQIGADELSRKAAALEDAGNAKDIDTILKNTDALLSLYAHYTDVLKPLFPDKQESGNKPVITNSVLLEEFENLAHAINDLNIDQMESSIQKLEQYSYNETNTELFKKLCDAVSNMDPDACEEIIAEWKKLM